MKKLIIVLLSICCMVVVYSCGGKKEPIVIPEIDVKESIINLPSSEKQTIKTTFSVNVPWTISLSDTKASLSWLTVDKTSGVAGSNTINISITQENTSTTNSRSGYIKITAGDKTSVISVIQPPSAPVLVDGVTLNSSSQTLGDGGTYQLTETITPSNATNKRVKWSSSDTQVASVSEAGLVTAVKDGSATITVTTVDGSKTATCQITVNANIISVTGVTLNSSSETLLEGSTYQLKVTIAPSTATNQSVTWSSSNAQVASVSEAGLVTAVKDGNATITVTTVDGSKTATCQITVKNPVTSVALNTQSVTLSKSVKTYQLVATINPSNATNKNVTWVSSNPSIATVSTSGLVTAVSGGNVTITVTSVDNNKSATCSVKVNSSGGLEDFEDDEL